MCAEPGHPWDRCKPGPRTTTFLFLLAVGLMWNPAEYRVEVIVGIEAHRASPAGCGGESKRGAIWLTKDRVRGEGPQGGVHGTGKPTYWLCQPSPKRKTWLDRDPD